jgi:hypothetical protein
MNNTNGYSDKVLTDLLTIEVCNLLDQNSNMFNNNIRTLKDRLDELKKV